MMCQLCVNDVSIDSDVLNFLTQKKNYMFYIAFVVVTEGPLYMVSEWFKPYDYGSSHLPLY
jgi:hypothetical protein